MNYEFSMSGNVHVTGDTSIPYDEIPEYAQSITEDAENNLVEALESRMFSVHFPAYDVIPQTKEDTITYPLVIEIPIHVSCVVMNYNKWESLNVDNNMETIVDYLIDLVSDLGYELEVGSNSLGPD